MATPPPPAPPPRRPSFGIAAGAAGFAVLAVVAWLWRGDPPAIIAAAPPPPQAAAPPAPAAVPVPMAAPPAPLSASAPAAAQPAPLAPPAPAPLAPAPAPPAPAPAPAAAAASAPPAVASPPVVPPSAAAPAAVAPPPSSAPTGPSFDIVRVTPQGSAVLAGRAAPGAEVILRSNGQEFGRTRADAQGQWVLAGAPPLAPGTHEITLAMRDAAGREIAGDGNVVAVVAAPAPVAVAAAPGAATPAAPAAPLVVLTSPQGTPTLLQAPGRAASRLGLDLVDYGDAGEIRFAGTAPPGATIRLYVDDAHVGDAKAGADGRWTLVPPATIAQGEHRLRLDQVDAARGVVARVELPFQRASVAAMEAGAMEAGAQRVVVQPRQNLWRIARRAYGQGVRYTEIFAANRDLIADPARIYPGQVFTVPGMSPAGVSTPSPANRSR